VGDRDYYSAAVSKIYCVYFRLLNEKTACAFLMKAEEIIALKVFENTKVKRDN